MANRLSGEANTHSDEANELATEANTIARQAMDSQIDADRVTRSADLMPIFEEGISSHGEGSNRIVRLTLQNRGMVTAHNVFVELHPSNNRPVVRYHSRKQMQPNEKIFYDLLVGDSIFEAGIGGRVVDFFVTYEDAMGNHEKIFRVDWGGMIGTSQSFQILDVGLDGKRIKFRDAPFKIAPGIGIYGDDSDSTG